LAKVLDKEATFVKRLKQINPPDSEAWKEFLVNYRPVLQGTIRNTLRKFQLPADRLDDIEQKTWLTAYTKIHTFELRRKNSLKNWLLTIQHNHVRNLSRQPNPVSIDEQVHPAVDLTLADQLEDDQSPDPEAEMISDETRREIWSALELAIGELSIRDQEIVSRRLIHKESVEDLAEAYNLKTQSIYQIISNTKKKLRSYLLAPDLFFRVTSDRKDKESSPWQK
jgi:RNA polymerase sigma factor (sigma-70 family)